MAGKGRTITNYTVNFILHGLVRGVLLLPYHWRIKTFGWIIAHVMSPLSGHRKIIRKHLAHACPDLSAERIKDICIEAPDNFGRSFIELYSGQEFADRMPNAQITGDGVRNLEEAHKLGRPVVLITGHFGNYDAVRVALINLGYNIGALYMPMKNLYFNDHYEAKMSNMGGELFSVGRKGMARLIKFLRGGGMTCFIADRYESGGAELTFFGKPATTALSAANMALKYDALFVPVYGMRQKNGQDFKVIIEAPIPHSDAKTMTQAANDSMEKMVRKHMGQWIWFHKRWGRDI